MMESIHSNNGLYKARTVFAVELHPSTVANVEEGVKEQINTHLLRYVDELKGVLLSYSNIEILTKKPIIHPYFPYFHVDVRANVLVFKPTPGMTLVGRVNHMGEDYISALVLGIFNVTIPARSVMPELHFLREENKWIHLQQPQHQIGEHSYIVFEVQEVRDHGGFFQLTGAMMDTNTGAADFLFPNLQLLEPPLAAGAEDGQMEPASNGDAVGMQAGGETATNGTVPDEEKHQDTHKHKDKRKRISDAATDDRRGKRQKDGGESFGAVTTPRAAAAVRDEPDLLVSGAAGQATEDKHKGEAKHKHRDKSGKEEKDDSDNKDKSKKKDKVHKEKRKDKVMDKDKDKSGRKDKKQEDGDKHAGGKGSGVAAAPAVDSAPLPSATAFGGAKQAVDVRPSGAKSSRPKVEESGGAVDQRPGDGAGAEVGKRPEVGGSEKKKHKDKDRKKDSRDLSQEVDESSKKSKKKDAEKQRG